MPTDEELEQMRKDIVAKRVELEEIVNARQQSEQSMVNDNAAAELSAELASLDAKIAQEKQITENQNGQVSSTLLDAKRRMEQAQAVQDALEDAKMAKAEEEAAAKAEADSEKAAAATALPTSKSTAPNGLSGEGK